MEKKQNDLALPVLLEANEYDPANPKILLIIGTIFAMKENVEKAVEFLDKAIDLDRNCREVIKDNSDYDGINQTKIFKKMMKKRRK
ncbi:MAG: tetratricopeptide repeat protein [Promethearchaeota archaeon]